MQVISASTERVAPPERAVALAREVLAWDGPSIDKFLGLPPQTEIPRPGDARSWGPEEWGEWCLARGFEDTGTTKHQVLYQHKTHPTLKIGVARTPGDWRSMMNCCTDFRRLFMSLRATLHDGLKLVSLCKPVPKPIAEQWASVDEADLDEAMVLNLTTVSRYAPAADLSSVTGGTRTVGDGVRIIDGLHRDGLVTSRGAAVDAFLTAWRDEVGDNTGGSIKTLLLEFPDTLPAPERLIEALSEWAREVRDLAKAERDVLREERSKAKAEKQRAKWQAPANEPMTPMQKHMAIVKKAKEALAQRVAFANDALDKAIAELNALTCVPEDYEALHERVKEAERAAKDTAAQLNAANASLAEERKRTQAHMSWLQHVAETHLGAQIGDPAFVQAAIEKQLAGRQRTNELEAFLLEAVEAIFESDWVKMASKVGGLRTRAEILIPAGHKPT